MKKRKDKTISTPEEEREHIVQSLRAEVKTLRKSAKMFAGARMQNYITAGELEKTASVYEDVIDVILFLPLEKW